MWVGNLWSFYPKNQVCLWFGIQDLPQFILSPNCFLISFLPLIPCNTHTHTHTYGHWAKQRLCSGCESNLQEKGVWGLFQLRVTALGFASISV